MAKIYTTKRIGNNGREYVGVNINNRQFEIPGRQITGTKTKKTIIPGMAKVTSTTYNPKNYQDTKMTANIYAKQDQSIKQVKVTAKELPRKTIIKTTKYGPVNYYGKQTKTKTKRVIKK